MGDVLIFTPRPKPVDPEIPEPLSDAELRVHLEEAAQTALDAADRIITVLNRMDGDADLEDGANAEPSLAAPEDHASQVGCCRGNDQDLDAEAAEPVLPEIANEPWPFPWSGRENALTACGGVLLTLVGG